jgi:hypothetical protein
MKGKPVYVEEPAGSGNWGQTAGTEHINDNQNTFEFATKAL